MITNTVTGRLYVGKRRFWAKRGKAIVPAAWRDYYGSSVDLSIDIQRYGKDAFRREMLMVCRTDYMLSYHETAELFRRDVLFATRADGSPAYYNLCIEGKWQGAKLHRDSAPATPIADLPPV